jgi:hypothetical protein
MANVAHSKLTGADLHENKGAAAATDDYVATVTSGATVWKKLTASNLTGTGNSFGAQLFHMREQKASGVASGSGSSPSWGTRLLDTSVTNEISSASLASNQFTLPAGTYHIKAFAAITAVASLNGVRLRVRNITDGSTALVGLNTYGSQSGTVPGTTAVLEGRFTIAGSKVFELQAYSNVNSGIPPSSGSGEVEVYNDVLIWKVA